ncbi:MAG: hypothetical protein GTN68_05765 [Candidatus Aminicenantes bacterium]|nr:hypothetical protein [Candidatus Aminicenantes bacterium]NIO80044.1 hypothetical protein [Candidatus Aminicenantes bacterium]NIQ66001.1 hypothetical protein [Candidatus Aminicenantes bacterium]
MKKFFLVLTVIILFFAGNATAENRGFGLGLIIGEPIGFSFKNWTGSKTAVTGGVAWSIVHGGSLHFHADYLIHNHRLVQVPDVKLFLYYGIGGRIKTRHQDRVGIRFPVGLCYVFEKIPLDVYLDIVPLLDLTPDRGTELMIGLGFIYYF